VKGSYPLPPEANATPVSRSVSSRSFPTYGGNSSLTPNLEAAQSSRTNFNGGACSYKKILNKGRVASTLIFIQLIVQDIGEHGHHITIKSW
jgi:hypothetical protein